MHADDDDDDGDGDDPTEAGYTGSTRTLLDPHVAAHTETQKHRRADSARSHVTH